MTMIEKRSVDNRYGGGDHRIPLGTPGIDYEECSAGICIRVEGHPGEHLMETNTPGILLAWEDDDE